MSDALSRAEGCRELAEECRRVAANRQASWQIIKLLADVAMVCARSAFERPPAGVRDLHDCVRHRRNRGKALPVRTGQVSMCFWWYWGSQLGTSVACLNRPSATLAKPTQ